MTTYNSSTPKVKELQFPISRVRTIMKSSPDVENIGQDALHLVTKATELFVQHFAKSAFKNSKQHDNLVYKDLADIVQSDENMTFLREILPRKITVREYREIIKEAEGSEEEEEEEYSS